jgi:hypothetical protein
MARGPPDIKPENLANLPNYRWFSFYTFRGQEDIEVLAPAHLHYYADRAGKHGAAKVQIRFGDTR